MHHFCIKKEYDCSPCHRNHKKMEVKEEASLGDLVLVLLWHLLTSPLVLPVFPVLQDFDLHCYFGRNLLLNSLNVIESDTL